MTNFLINSSDTNNLGSEEADLFQLNTAKDVTIKGKGGDDTVSANAAVNGSDLLIQGAEGADSIFFTANSIAFDESSIRGGAGADFLAFDAGSGIGSSKIAGGGGADTLQMSAVLGTSLAIGMGGGNDLVSASALTLFSASLTLGGGDDTLQLTSASGVGSTIRGGGGADVISASIGTASALQIYGDAVSSQYYGNDTITISGTMVGQSAYIFGGGGADSISIQTGIVDATGSTIIGGNGKDFITLDAVESTANILYQGGAGADTIALTGDSLATGFGTIEGGAGADVISVSAAVTSVGSADGALIIGGDGADSINLGDVVTGANTSVVIRYNNFGESNLSAMDVITSDFTASGGSALAIQQSAVSAEVATGYANANWSTDTGGLVTFVSAKGNGVTARAEQLDAGLEEGKTVVFADSSGIDYLFIQGGAEGGGTSDDLLVQIVTSLAVGSGLTTVGGTSVVVNFVD